MEQGSNGALHLSLLGSPQEGDDNLCTRTTELVGAAARFESGRQTDFNAAWQLVLALGGEHVIEAVEQKVSLLVKLPLPAVPVSVNEVALSAI